MLPLIDLRSDTVTQPCAAMRRAMAAAEVGDDVYGEDPTVQALEAEVAARLNFPAALWTPSGTMANQLALHAHCQPGDEVLMAPDSHCWRYESGAMAALAGVQPAFLGASGVFSANDLTEIYRAPDTYSATQRLVVIENTHNVAGGRPWDRNELAAVIAQAHALSLGVHIDGARLWNAAAASGVTPAELVRGATSVSVCLSKGLGAPAGSVLVGAPPFIARCRRLRKMYGGGMRQVGILAAAGRYALAHNLPKLHDDHRRAAALAAALAAHPGLRAEPYAGTNMVMLAVLPNPRYPDAASVAAAAAAQGLRLSVFGPQRLRAVTHLDIDDALLARAIATLHALWA